MLVTCLGALYGKKNPKWNACLMNAGFKDMLLDLSQYAYEYALENENKVYEQYLRNPSRDEYFIPKQPEKMYDVASKYHMPKLKQFGWSTTIAKTPCLMKNTERLDAKSIVYDLTCASIEVAKEMGVKYLLVNPLLRMDCSKSFVETNRSFYLSLAEKVREANMQILIPNDYDNFQGHYNRGFYADAYSLKDFVDELNSEIGSELFGICMDIGVCNLLGQNMYEVACVWGKRIKAVIVRENDGVDDRSLLPFTCAQHGKAKVDWLSLIRGLRKIGFDGNLIMDFRDTAEAHSHMLQSQLCTMALTTANFLAWQLSIENTIRKYNKRVLFGAGNMCRNYMKCYGEEYPPLYTCDNNEKIWGSVFEGLEIKNPEELKKLPEDCAIFICNIYYDEIEKQLRDMGIKNPIERYNDEYLPSMYTDRFDSNRREVQS